MSEQKMFLQQCWITMLDTIFCNMKYVAEIKAIHYLLYQHVFSSTPDSSFRSRRKEHMHQQHGRLYVYFIHKHTHTCTHIHRHTQTTNYIYAYLRLLYSINVILKLCLCIYMHSYTGKILFFPMYNLSIFEDIPGEGKLIIKDVSCFGGQLLLKL